MRRAAVRRAVSLLVLIAAAFPASGQDTGQGAAQAAAHGPERAAALAPEAAEPGWFLERLAPESDAARAMRAAATPTEALAALDRHLLATRVGGVPLDFISHGGALESFRADRSVRIRRYPPRSLVPPIDWASGPDATFLAELHSWRYLTPLLEAWRTEGDAEMLAAAEQVARDWWRANGEPPGASPRAWHEGSVVKRAMVLVQWLQVLAERPHGASPPSGGMAPDDQASRELPPHALAWLLDHHLQALLAPRLYRGPGNHEIRQDLALVLGSLALPDFAAAAGWRDLALERTVEVQIRRGFSAEGVWREHSPAYHGYVMLLFLRLHEALAANGVPVPAPLAELLAASDRYMAAILTPAGLYPPLGDSAEQAPPRDLVERSPQVAFAASRGARGTAPEGFDAVYPDAGQAVLADRPASAPDAGRRLWVLVHAGQHLPMGHRHEDALSVIAHFDGRWWLREAGRYGYRDGPERRFVLSQAAHNGHRLAGRSPDPRDLPHLEAGLAAETVSTPALGAVRAASQRFPAARASARRVVALLRSEKVLLVADRLEAPFPGWESFFNLAPDLDVAAAAPGRLLVTPAAPAGKAPETGGWVLDVHLDPRGGDSAEVVRGATHPRLGWVSLRDLELAPAPVIVLRRPERSFERVTLFHWRRPGEPPLEDLRATPSPDGIAVTWRREGWETGLTARFAGEPAAWTAER